MTDRKPENQAHSTAATAQAETAEHLEMKIPARAEWVRVVRLATAGVSSRVGFSYDEIEDIKLAVTEACNNAILHSAPVANDADKGSAATPVVTIRWRDLGDGVSISVADEGRLSAPVLKRKARSTPEASTPEAVSLDDLPEGGMGLLLIESLMDEVRHESGPHDDTTIHMTKFLKPVNAGVEDASVQSAGAESVENKTSSTRPDPDAPVALHSSDPAARLAGASPSTR